MRHGIGHRTSDIRHRASEMLFHTWDFLVFFLIVFPVYFFLRRYNGPMNLWLLAASYVFYGWWNPYYLILIAATTTLDWWIGLRMGREGARRKFWLVLTVLSNVGCLAFFKYAGFVTNNLNALLGTSFANPAKDLMTGLGMAYLLPVGISFFTFQSMSYTIDVYRGKIPVERSLLRFATFVSLFPQLVAGPIERASNLLPQLHKAPRITRRHLTDGGSQFLVGLFKKVALADYLALYVDKVYADPGSFQSGALVLATVAFAWQIYFDFSGYTDMARGIGHAMGFRFMQNFDNPYVATGLGDFWSRWHISLSTWFKDYLYFPLGGNRNGKLATYRNMLVTMIVSGVWHGAAWTFVIWGALHAAGRVLTRELEGTSVWRDRVPRLAKQVLVFAFVCFAWIFFRARTLDDAWTVATRMFTTGWGDPQFPLLMAVIVGAVWGYQLLYTSGVRMKALLETAPVRVGLAAAMIVYLSVFAQPSLKAFIYFDF